VVPHCYRRPTFGAVSPRRDSQAPVGNLRYISHANLRKGEKLILSLSNGIKLTADQKTVPR
jgi:hypothetical protein